jgi:transcriptional regulator with XRE-family HTH domain
VDGLPIGRRVAYWRGRRRMSQQAFADRLGKSKSWVDKVERGVRRLDRFSVIDEIADVLEVDTQLLLGLDPHWPGRDAARRADRVEVTELRAALERYDQVTAFLSPPLDPPDLDQLRKGIAHAWLTFQHADGAALTRSLPLLLRLTQAAGAGGPADLMCADTARLLSQVHLIASSTLRNLGEHELARLAADRAVTAAQRAGDDLLVGVAVLRVGLALLALGRVHSAFELYADVADRLAPGAGRPDDPQRWSVHGALLLEAAVAAGRLGHEATTRDLLAAAEQAAGHVGVDDNHYWTCFGPTNVALHRAAAAVELGDGRAAIAVHERIRGPELAAMVPERRVHHLVDVARACVQVGDVRRAVELLCQGRRLAPAEFRSRPRIARLTDAVLRRYRGTPPPELREIAAAVVSPP